MSDISKQFGAWATSLKKSEFHRATLRLTVYYTAGVCVILLVSSFTIYQMFTSSRFAPEPLYHEISYNVETGHPEDARGELYENLLDILAIVDGSILVLMAIASYFFARRTLRPIETVYRAQERFVGNVAHELRTPLAVLKSGTESLLHKPREQEAYVTFLKDSLDEVNRMTRLSDDLLYLLRHQHSTSVEMDRVDLGEITRREVAHFTPYAQEHQVHLDVDITDAATVQGKSDDLHRLVQNLIKNAVDYNRAGGTVHVAVKTHDGHVILTVHDSGIGIAESDQRRVFERFYKADRSRTATRGAGTGLGLPIVKEIADAHAASVTLESTEGEGTSVSITFSAA